MPLVEHVTHDLVVYFQGHCVMYLEGQVIVVVRKNLCIFEGLVVFFTYLTFTSAGVHNLHPARYLLPY